MREGPGYSCKTDGAVKLELTRDTILCCQILQCHVRLSNIYQKIPNYIVRRICNVILSNPGLDDSRGSSLGRMSTPIIITLPRQHAPQ